MPDVGPGLPAVQRLARFAVQARQGLPEEVGRDVVDRVTDVLGNALAARTSTVTAPAGSAAEVEPDRAVLAVVKRWGGTPESAVLGERGRLPAPSAALVNGTLAHALDFDDTHLPSIVHPSASVVPAALAVGESTGSSGTEVVAAIAVGDEVTDRLGYASYLPELANSVFFDKGLHATSICGTVGAAAAAGLLLGLDEEGIAAAMAVAASMGAGLLEANRTGGSVKRIHCGWAAHAGVSAGELAAAGVTGPPTVLEGRFGFFHALSDGRWNPAALLEDLGTRWELLRTVYKPYPSNHFTHPGIDCALALREAGLDPADVEEAELGVAGPTLRTIAEPTADKARPPTGYAAKFSGPFTVATALRGGGGLGVYLDDFGPDSVLDEDRVALASRVRCVTDPQATAAFPGAFGAVLRVRTRGGARLEHRVESSRGGPEHPLSRDELREKFRLNAGRALPPAAVTALEHQLNGLTSAGDVRLLLEAAGSAP